jgi:hypothetical protein
LRRQSPRRAALVTVLVVGFLFGLMPSRAVWSSAPFPAGMFHRAGAYVISTPTDMSQASPFGLTYAMTGYQAENRPFPYVDGWIKNRIYDHYRASCGIQISTCTMPAPELAGLEREVKAHLARSRKDNRILAYYVLDDYRGPMAGVLSAVHSWVMESNRGSSHPKGTLCALAGVLDYTPTPGAAAVSNDVLFDQALTNYSSDWCDMVSLYPYASDQAKADTTDWAMTRVMPRMLAGLRAKGWDPTRSFIGTPQAFGYPDGVPGSAIAPYYLTPSAGQLAVQTEAFCRAGAASILAYAWNDGRIGTADELVNTSDLRSGLALGVMRCQMVWAGD